MDDVYGQQPAPQMTPLQTLLAVITRPQAAFERLARNPEWVLPTVMLLLGIGALRITQGMASARYVTEMMQRAPQPRGTFPTEMVGGFTLIISVFTVPIIVAGTWFVRTGILWILGLLFSGEGEFMALLSAIGYAWLPFLMQHLLLAALYLAIPDVILQRPDMSQLKDPAVMQAVVYRGLLWSVGQHLSPFAIWNLILCTMAVGATLKLSRGQAIAVALIPWILQLIWRVGSMLFWAELSSLFSGMTPQTPAPYP